ncbi:MAG TPA: alpha/beta fold hydrolase [Polyangiaceae bacterium]|jgi:carboxylesterase|nr:alpha/beta fold hydrolase [Polyangiaceae bacterium]
MLIENRRRTLVTQRMLGHGPREIHAKGRGLCVVGFHGFTGTAAELRPILEAAASAGFAVDGGLLPGHGTLATDLQPKTFDDWVASARDRVRAAVAAYERVVLVGFSLGTLVAMQVASEAVEGVVGLVVLGTAITLGAGSRWPLGLWARAGLPMPDLYLVKPRPGDMDDTRHADDLVTYDRHPLRAALEVYRAGPRVRRVAGAIRCPALILHGRHDIVCPVSNAGWLAANLGTRDAGLRIFERSAHVLALDGERDEVAGEVLHFLAQRR